MDATQALLVLLVALVLGWFAFGTIANIRRGNAVLRWMQGGLPRLGERTTLRWLGSSVVQLEIAKARPPFRRVALVLVLEPRDVPWLWLLSHRQGRRDTFILRADLRQAPQHSFDLLAPGAWNAPRALEGWDSETVANLAYRAPKDTPAPAREQVQALLLTTQRISPVVWRLSSRRSVPHLELHIPFPDARSMDAPVFCDALAALAQQLAG
jgi:hypothetical protein